LVLQTADARRSIAASTWKSQAVAAIAERETTMTIQVDTTSSGPTRIALHFRETYLGLSENFAYEFLSHAVNFVPFVVAERIENIDKFPLDYVYPVPRLKIAHFINRVSWRFLRRDLLNAHDYRSMLRQIAGMSPLLIHAHFGPYGYYALPLKRRLRIPLVTTFYGRDVSAFPQIQFWRKAYEKLFQEGDLFLVEGPYMRERLVNLGCPECKVRIQRIAVDLTKFPFRFRTCPADGKPVRILMCGRFVEKKGFEYGVQAFAEVLRTSNYNLELRIVGDGPLRPRVESLIRRLGISEKVVLLGYLDHVSYAEEIHQAHVLMAPSVTAHNGDSEGGAPTVLLEAQASGLPVLSTYHADIPFVVRDGCSGYLSRERDVFDLARKLQLLLNDSDTWGRLGLEGRQYVEKYHNIEQAIYQMEKIYESIARAGVAKE